jgi:hypothetical protein
MNKKFMMDVHQQLSSDKWLLQHFVLEIPSGRTQKGKYKAHLFNAMNYWKNK